MIERRGYLPWGLLVERQQVYNAGGGPAWHARKEQYDLLQQDPHLQACAVRLGAGSSDWLEEREWRIVRDADVSLQEVKPFGLLVGDPSWTGAKWTQPPGLPYGHWYPAMAPGLVRLYWDYKGAKFEWLPPLFG